MIPNSRVRSDLIFQAFNLYIKNEIKSQFNAALHIGCENRQSFRLYYQRILAKQDIWCSLFTKKGEESFKYFSPIKKWEIIKVGLKDWPPPDILHHWESYSHSILVYKKMGLGP